MTWPTKKLGEVIELHYGKGILKHNRKPDGKYVIYGANGELGRSDKYLVDAEAIIVGRKGSAGEITRVFGKFWPSDVTYYILGNQKINIDYLYRLLKSLNLQRFAVGVKPGINRNRIYEIEIPLPPIAEQRKIVARVERLLGKVKEARRLRGEAMEAVQNLLSAELHRIFEEGKKKGWEEKELGDIVEEINSGFACGKQNEVTEGIVHLRTHNIDTQGNLNFNKIIRIPKKLVNNKAFGILIGDILFNNTNSTELVGKTALVVKDLQYAFSNHLTRIRVKRSVVFPEWIVYVFNVYWRKKYFENICCRWVGQSGINQGTLKQIKILLPPLVEQKKIVERLDSLSQKLRQVQDCQKSTQADLVALEQSILHKAFSGEL